MSRLSFKSHRYACRIPRVHPCHHSALLLTGGLSRVWLRAPLVSPCTVLTPVRCNGLNSNNISAAQASFATVIIILDAIPDTPEWLLSPIMVNGESDMHHVKQPFWSPFW